MPRIVVIEDDGALRMDLVEQLRAWGHKVAEANDADAGESLVESLQPDIVLCDVGLPSENGFQLTERLRRDNPGLIIVFISARGGDRERIYGEQCGADDYVVKPIDYALLSGKLEYHMKKQAGVSGRVKNWILQQYR